MALATQVLQANLQRKIKAILDAPFDEKSDPEQVKNEVCSGIINGDSGRNRRVD